MEITEATPTYEIEALYTWVRDVAQDLCPECGEPKGFCYSLCSHSPDYYSAEQEREDTLYNDSLPYDAWFALSVVHYEAIHGEGSYCS